MALPVFGRGRALYALVGKGINEDTIEEACKFVTGPCGCEVKRQNPGMDLLMLESWEAKLQEWKNAKENLPPLTGLPQAVPLEIKRTAESSVPPVEATAREASGNLMRNLLIVLGLGVASVAIATVVMLRLTKRN